MDLLFWMSVGFIIIGFVVLVSLKRYMESDKSSTKSKIWWIAGTTVWGVATLYLVVLVLFPKLL